MKAAEINKIIRVDLTEKTSEVIEEPSLFDKYLGGSSVAVRLLLKECAQGEDPFSPENPLIFMTGPLNALYPCMPKTVAVFKSPITGNMGESHAGGNFATAIRLAGYAGIIIKGFAEKLTYLSISNSKVEFADATSIKRFSTIETDVVLRGLSPRVKGIQSIVCTGPAGESMVSCANVVVDKYNSFGRLGLGAVMGAKNLKGIVVKGLGEIEVENQDDYRMLYEEIHKQVIETNKMDKYHYVGTPVNVMVLDAMGVLPTRNFKETKFEYAHAISGELICETLLEKKISCALCPIGCMHIAKLKIPFKPGYEYEPTSTYYNYESIFALGSNLGIGRAEDVLRLILTANKLGIDTMMMGGILAWATEAFEKGMITTEETLDIEPKWGDWKAYLKMIELMIEMPNEFYMNMAQGLDGLAETYGGREFAISLCGNTPAGYHTGYAHIIGTMVGARHSHNSNAGYSIDQKIIAGKLSQDEIIEELIKEENWRYAYTSLVGCMFARNIYDSSLISKALKTIGIERSPEELQKLGSETYHKAYEFKFREGFSFDKVKVKIPDRLFEAETPSGRLNKETLLMLLRKYTKSVFGFRGSHV